LNKPPDRARGFGRAQRALENNAERSMRRRPKKARRKGGRPF